VGVALLSCPHSRAALARTLRPAVDALGDPAATPAERDAAILRGDGSSVAAGHPVLGTPIGSPDYIHSVVSSLAQRAVRLIPILDRLLLLQAPRGSMRRMSAISLLIRGCDICSAASRLARLL